MTNPDLSRARPGDDGAPPPSKPTATPKAPAPPLMSRAPRPGAVRIRKPVVQGAVMVAALLVSGSLAWAFVVQPQMTRQARDAAAADGAGKARGSVRPSQRVSAPCAPMETLVNPPPARPTPSPVFPIARSRLHRRSGPRVAEGQLDFDF